jgi:xanthine/uracil permease
MSSTTHPVDEVLPAPRLAALGIQHVLVLLATISAVVLNAFFNGTRVDEAEMREAAMAAEA